MNKVNLATKSSVDRATEKKADRLLVLLGLVILALLCIQFVSAANS